MLEARIATALDSPFYEAYEYIFTYLNFYDIILSIFLLCCLILTLIYYPTTKVSKKMRIYSFPALIVLILILQNQKPLSYIKNIYTLYQQNQTISNRNKYIKSLSLNTKNAHKPLYDRIVVIQGEAANKKHMHLYGYNKNTTPFLSKLFNEGKLYRFNAISPTNQTRYSIPMELIDIQNKTWEKDFSHKPSLLSTLKSYDYTTYWISNQGKKGKHDNFIYSIAQEAKVTKFFNENFNNASQDSVITHYLRDIGMDFNTSFYFLHLMGSHANYENRYPKEKALHSTPKNIIEHYDNSIYFTDFILKNIFDMALSKNKKTLILYLSDHGEVISKTKHGHGFYPTAKEEYEIPFVIYSTIQNNRIDTLIQQNTTQPINTKSLANIIEYLNYMTDSPDISFSSKVICLTPKIIVDYNELTTFKNHLLFMQF